MLTKTERIKYSGLFQQAYEKGKTLYSKNLRLTFTQTRDDLKEKLPLIGISIGKSYSRSAVKRNRLKRQLREVYRLYRLNEEHAGALSNLGLVTVGIKKSVFPGSHSYEMLKKELESLLEKATNTQV